MWPIKEQGASDRLRERRASRASEFRADFLERRCRLTEHANFHELVREQRLVERLDDTGGGAPVANLNDRFLVMGERTQVAALPAVQNGRNHGAEANTGARPCPLLDPSA